jgi:hypothetical protein
MAALAAVVASMSTVQGAAAAAAAPAGPAGIQRAAHVQGSQTAGGPGDVAVTGSGDLTGYHLYVASRQGGWRWRPLATIQPGGGEGQGWIGQECVTGDGHTVVAVVAPWSASNSAAGMDAGGLAYAVTVPGGAVRPLAGGLSLAYFDPGCGLGDTVALTSYAGPQQRPTKVSVLDAATGAVTATSTVPGEVTSAVPVGRRILAAQGGQLLDITGNRATVLASFRGQVSSLHPAASGGVDLVAQAGGGRAGIWSAGGGHPAHQLGAGPAMMVHLLGGLEGHNLATGTAALARGAGLTRLRDVADLTGASVQGGLELTERAGVQHTAAAADGRAIAEIAAGAGQVADTTLPAPAVRRTETMPSRSVAVAVPSAITSSGAAKTGRRVMADGAVINTPKCAVPRNNIYNQAWQPSSAQVRWAVNQAVQGDLTPQYTEALRPPDPGEYAIGTSQTPLPPEYADNDYPLLANVPDVPPLVMYGILAQESNWNQASWHAIPGRPGDPLVANYYGDNANANSIDYSQADCGYGIAQVTSFMTQNNWNGSDNTPPAQPTGSQVRVAVDYATNIAAGVQILQSEWDGLHSLGITLNNGDATKIENWYAAIWAYNTGVHNGPPGANKGLGWLNNPANPIYPFPRHPFLHDRFMQTYGDAAHPNLWPYQERVFGWMEVPQLDLNGNPKYNGTFDWTIGSGKFLNLPTASDFCSPTINNCNPSVIGTPAPGGGQADPCPAEDSSCWFDAPVSWTDCSTACITDTPLNTPSGQTDYPTAGAAEPSAPPLSATCAPGANTPVTTSDGSLIPGTVLVDDEMLADQNPAQNTPNLMGCQYRNAALTPPVGSNASFQLLDRLLDGRSGPIDSDQTPSSAAAIDLHQLGAGLGGHLFFTHTVPGDSNGRSMQEVRGVWQATLPASTTTGTVYQIYAFVPDVGAGAGYAPYQIDSAVGAHSGQYGPPGERHATLYRVINQANYSNQWVSLGYYLCGGPDQFATPPQPAGPANCTMSVTLSNVTPSNDPTQGSDIAYNAVAFVPAPLGRNVIIGDSYSSGEGLQGGFDDGTDVSSPAPGTSQVNANLCHRAPGAWGRLWDPNAIQLSCSGSNMWDVAGVLYYQDLQGNTVPTNTGSVYYQPPANSTISASPSDPPAAGTQWTSNGPSPDGNTPWNFDNAGSDYYAEPTFQTDLLRALQPKRVVLTVGGNDAMFADVLRNCTNQLTVLANPCQNLYANPGSSKDKLDQRILSLAGPLTAAFTNIANAAGGPSKVVVLTYPNLFAPNPAVIGNAFDCSFVGNADQLWLVPKAQELDDTITSAAQAAGIPGGNIVNEHDAFLGHDICATTDIGDISDVTEPSASGVGNSVLDNYFHPNADGYQALKYNLAQHFSP